MSALERMDPPPAHLLTITVPFPEHGPPKLYIDGEFVRDLIAPCTLEAWTYLTKEDCDDSSHRQN